jgi:polysaccharide pyruvyl transferase WcaK-like protein
MLAGGIGRLARHRWAPSRESDAMESYRRASLIVSAGGAYLGGSKPGTNFIKNGNIRAARYAGRSTIVAPITVNPFSTAVGQLIRWGLKDTKVFVRDEPSRALLEGLAVEASLVPDIALRAPTLLRIASEARRDHSTSMPRTIGWAPRGYRRDHADWGQPEQAEQQILAAVRHLLSVSNDRLMFLPHVRAGPTDDDLATVNRLVGQLSDDERDRISISETPTTLMDAVRRYRDVDVLITSRMHAAIFAMATGTPALTVAYEPKVRGVMTEVGLADRVIPASMAVSVAEIVEMIRRLGLPTERARTIAALSQAQRRFAAFDRALEVAVRRQ